MILLESITTITTGSSSCSSTENSNEKMKTKINIFCYKNIVMMIVLTTKITVKGIRR